MTGNLSGSSHQETTTNTTANNPSATSAQAGQPQGMIPEEDAWRALVALCIGFFMILLDQTIVAVATPDFQSALNADYSQVLWVTSVYLLTYAVPLLVTGRLGDQIGPKNVYVAGMVVFTLSSLGCGLAPDIHWLIAARAVQGLGAALLTPQTMSVINRIFARERRGAAMGLWGATAGMAGLAGPVLGGLLTTWIGWEWIFFVNVPIGVVSVIMVLKWVPQLPTRNHGYDWGGIVTSVIAVFLLVFALQEGGNANWAPWIWIMIAASIVVFGIFIMIEKWGAQRGVEVLVPLSLFKDKNFSVGNISITTMGFAVAGPMVPIMIYFQQFHHMSALKAGLMMVPMALISGLLSPFVGRLSDTVPPRRLSLTGFTFMTLSMLCYFLVMKPDTSVWWMFVPIALQGLGNAFVWAPNSTTTMRDLPMEKTGAGSGVYNTTRQVGSVIGSATVAATLDVFMQHTDPVSSLGWTMIFPATVLLVGLVVVTQFQGTTAATRGK